MAGLLDIRTLGGDIVLTRGHAWFSRRIRRCEQSPGEAPSVFNHVGTNTLDATIRTTRLVEALWRVREHSLIENYGGKREEVAIYRRLDLSETDRRKIVEKARTYVGKKYGWWKILAHGLDELLSRTAGRDVYFVRRGLFIDRRPICSWVTAEAYDVLRIRFCGKHPHACQPDDIADEVIRSPVYRCILPLTRLPKA